jgi:hypothetical protein
MRFRRWAIVLAACLPLQAVGQTAPLDCPVGPVTKVFGGSSWLVRSCVDDRTITLMPADGSPARPSFIVLAPSGGSYLVSAEGNNPALRLAVNELAKLSVSDVQALIAEIKRQPK